MSRPPSATRAHVLPRGNGTKTALSAAPDGVTPLDLSGLSGVIEYQPGEFTFTALAGTRVTEIAAVLAEHGQYLPFDPLLAEAGATLGGTVAAGANGPGRYHYGGLRDFILGVRYVDGEGQIVYAGGKVVKNAAGFDIPKLMVGSLGQFGALVEMTFKVFPKPEANATLRLECASVVDGVERHHPADRPAPRPRRGRPGGDGDGRHAVGAPGWSRRCAAGADRAAARRARRRRRDVGRSGGRALARSRGSWRGCLPVGRSSRRR